MPFAAQWWSSIYDVVFLIKKKEGEWVYGPDVERLRGREFVGLINNGFTDKKDVFFLAVTRSCEPLTPNARLILAYRCGSAFWEMYHR